MLPLPFTNIAVSLSGGGFRATTFHLGALSYLNNREFDGKSILEEVKVISTISGGTFTGAMYALRLAQGKTFDDCFHDLYEALLNEQLVDLALHKLSNPSTWTNPHKSKDMINAFAEVYNEVLFEGATFDVLYNGSKSHLSDVVFGSSEFTYGIQFRFQEEKGQGRFGNHYLNIPPEAAREVRIADAVAASSCFPGGFEPMIMPMDFGNGPESAVDRAWQKKKDEGLKYPHTAIMDGGIIDNQGIEGVKRAEERHSTKDEPFIGTYIVSDVSGEMMKSYEVPILKEGGFKNMITLRRLNILFFILLFGSLGTLIFTDPNTIFTIVLASVLTLTAIWFRLYFFARRKLADAIEGAFGADHLQEYLKDFRLVLNTPVYILMYLVEFRLSSVMKMVTDVFLRRIRRLSLDSLYGSDHWNYRFKSNYIYTLENKNEDLSAEMKSIILAANSMPTTLWFTMKELQDKVLDDLIACGQFTQCYNLKEYLNRIISGRYKETVWDKLDEVYQNKLLTLQNNIEADWAKFKENPKWMLEQQFDRSGIM